MLMKMSNAFECCSTYLRGRPWLVYHTNYGSTLRLGFSWMRCRICLAFPKCDALSLIAMTLPAQLVARMWFLGSQLATKSDRCTLRAPPKWKHFFFIYVLRHRGKSRSGFLISSSFCDVFFCCSSLFIGKRANKIKHWQLRFINLPLFYTF